MTKFRFMLVLNVVCGVFILAWLVWFYAQPAEPLPSGCFSVKLPELMIEVVP